MTVGVAHRSMYFRGTMYIIENFSVQRNLFNNHFTEMCSGPEACSYLRLMDSCITQLKAPRPSATCTESKEERENSRYKDVLSTDLSTVFPVKIPFKIHCVHRVSSNLLGPVVPSFRASSGRLKFTVRRHKFNKILSLRG